MYKTDDDDDDDEQHLYSAIYLQKHSKAPGSLNMSHIIRNVLQCKCRSGFTKCLKGLF